LQVQHFSFIEKVWAKQKILTFSFVHILIILLFITSKINYCSLKKAGKNQSAEAKHTQLDTRGVQSLAHLFVQ